MHATALVLLGNEWAGAWGSALGRACGQGGLCVLLVGAVCRLVPRLPAADRAWLWWLACLKLTVGLLCVAPVALPVLPHAPSRPPVLLSRLSPALPVAFAPKAPPAANSAGAGKISPLPPPELAAGGPPLASPHLGPVTVLWLLWLAGVGLALGRDARQWLRLRRRLGRLPAGAPPRIVETPAVTGPLVTGLRRPVILLPAGAALSAEERAMALAHEQAHLRRGDLWWGLLPSLTQALLFFFPPARWAVREYALAREEACDAEALRRTGAAPAQYARLLLRFASGATTAPALGLGTGYHGLRRRLTTLPQESRRPLSPRMRRLAALGLALGLLFAVPWQLTAATGKLAGERETPLPDPATLRFALTDLGAVDGNGTGATGINDRGQVVGCVEDGARALFGQAVLWDRGRVSDLGALPGDTYCRANGINNAGQVIASSYRAFDHNRAFVWQGGQKTELVGLSGYPHSKALSLNDRGQVVGYAQTGTHNAQRELVARAALWTGGQPADLGTLGGDYSAAYGINDRSQVVGKADTAFFGSTHAFLWQNGRMTDLGTLGGENSLALRVNRTGQVVGYSETGSTVHAFLWQAGAMRDLGTLPDADASEAHALNDRGQIVGTSDDAAVLWQAGQVADLNHLVPAGSGWTLQDATGINARGQIVGRGTVGGHVHAFLLTPVARKA